MDRQNRVETLVAKKVRQWFAISYACNQLKAIKETLDNV